LLPTATEKNKALTPRRGGLKVRKPQLAYLAPKIWPGFDFILLDFRLQTDDFGARTT
jgi:hypothetical protein